MILHSNYTRLSKPLYLLGVPTKIFIIEIIFLFFVTIGIKKWLLVIPIVIFHFVLMSLYKISATWLKEFIFYINIPFRRIYKGKIAYLPKIDDF